MADRRPSLRNIFDAHSGKISDKWSLYIDEYTRLFEPLRRQPIRLLEIGVQNGGSLDIWRKYFPRADLVMGCDIDAKCEILEYPDPKIKLIIGDANEEEVKKKIRALTDGFDIIIDDGSHQSSDIIRTFSYYFGQLAAGGLYIAEDLHCSYFQQFGGGIFFPYSSIAFFKSLADTINHEHWGVERSRTWLLQKFESLYGARLTEPVLAQIHSVEFVNSMCIVRKASGKGNALGQRRVSGEVALVSTDMLRLDGSLMPVVDQAANPWANRDMSIEDEMVLLKADTAECHAALDRLRSSMEEQGKSSAFEIQRLLRVEADLNARIEDLRTTITGLKNSYQSDLSDAQAQVQATRDQIKDIELKNTVAELRLRDEIQQASAKTAELLEASVGREQRHHDELWEINARLLRSQEDYELQLLKNSEREYKFHNEIEQLRAKIAELFKAGVDREQHHLLKVEELYEAQKDAAARTQQAHQDELSEVNARLLQSQRDYELQLADRAQREAEFEVVARELLIEQRSAEMHAERERQLVALINSTSQRGEEYLNRLAASERFLADQTLKFSQERQDLLHLHHLEKAEASQEFQSRIATKDEEVAAMLRRHAAEEVQKQTELAAALARAHDAHRQEIERREEDWAKQLMASQHEKLHAVADLNRDLCRLRNSLSWRLTAPFRMLRPVQKQRNVQIERLDLESKSQRAMVPMENAKFVQEGTVFRRIEMDFLSKMEQLLLLEGQDFVRAAYLQILLREPDREGFDYYLGRLNDGADKLEILGQLRSSKEGRLKSSEGVGFERIDDYYRAVRAPVIGRLLKLVRNSGIWIEMLARLRRLDARLSSNSADVGVQFVHLNDAVMRADRTIAQLGQQIIQMNARLVVLEQSSDAVASKPLAREEQERAISAESESAAHTLNDVTASFQVVPVNHLQSDLALDITSKLEINLGVKFQEPSDQKNTRNRYPNRMMLPGDQISQYFVCSAEVLSSVTLYFYTYTKRNSATVRVQLFRVLSDLQERSLADKVLEGDAIVDGSAVHVWLSPDLKKSKDTVIRIEVTILQLAADSHITVALGPSGERALPSVEEEGQPVHTLAFAINRAPDYEVRKFFAFVSGCPGDAFRYRCVHIGEALSNLGYSVDVFEPGEQHWPTLSENYNVVVLHRVAYDNDVGRFLERAERNGVAVVFDTDDLIFNPKLANQIDAYNEMNSTDQALYLNGLERYKRTISACRFVTVSTEKLAAEVQRLRPDAAVAILRNVVSKKMVDLANRQNSSTLRGARRKTVIAYFSGTKTHRKDFATCQNALLRILRKFEDVHLLIVGHLELPSAFLEFANQIEIVPFVPWESLAELYQRVDINLAPLEYENPFTEAKSELKFLEAAILGKPTVAANVGAYSYAITSGVDGILCATEEEWFEGISKLVVNRGLMEQIGDAARHKVLQHSTTFKNGGSIQSKLAKMLASHHHEGRPSIAFILRAPIANTGGGYKKIFILAKHLKLKHRVVVHVEPIAHLAGLSDDEIFDYCEVNFEFDRSCVKIGFDDIDADVLIATNWPTAPIAAAVKTARMKCYFVQDYEAEFYPDKDPLYFAADKTYDLPLSIITIGDYLKNKLEHRDRWCRSIPFAIDLAFLKSIPKQQEKSKDVSVLFFARPAIPRRNFDIGVAALKMLYDSSENIHISLYGLDAPVDLPFPFENLGLIKQPELAEVMANTDIHLSYSLTNISTVIYEAMACGCACVEADVEAVRPMVRNLENCVLAEPTAAGTFRVLSQLVADADLRRRLSNNGVRYAKTLSEKNMCASFQTALDEMWMFETSS